VQQLQGRISSEDWGAAWHGMAMLAALHHVVHLEAPQPVAEAFVAHLLHHCSQPCVDALVRKHPLAEAQLVVAEAEPRFGRLVQLVV